MAVIVNAIVNSRMTHISEHLVKNRFGYSTGYHDLVKLISQHPAVECVTYEGRGAIITYR